MHVPVAYISVIFFPLVWTKHEDLMKKTTSETKRDNEEFRIFLQSKIVIKIEVNKTRLSDLKNSKAFFFFCSHFSCSLRKEIIKRFLVQWACYTFPRLPFAVQSSYHKLSSSPQIISTWWKQRTYSNSYICDWFRVLGNLPSSWFSFLRREFECTRLY